MGVSGCSKTTIGQLLSKQLELPYYDADDFHPKSNIDKMTNGIPLTDKDRIPWLNTLAFKISKWESKGGAILACSALKEKYRIILSSNFKNITWIYLFGTYNLIKSRTEKRNNHFMKASMLKSQFDILEVPNYGIHINIESSPKEISAIILSKLNNYE